MYDILIVGAGPAGATLARLVGRTREAHHQYQAARDFGEAFMTQFRRKRARAG